MIQRRPALVLLFLCAALVAALAILPAISRDPNGEARAAALAAAPPYGRLVIDQDGINARIRSHQIGVSDPGSGIADFTPMTVVKGIDADAPVLFEEISTGVHLEEVVVRVFKTDSTDERITYTLEDALVSEVQHDGLTESLSFTYGRITIEAAGNNYCFDVAQRQEC